MDEKLAQFELSPEALELIAGGVIGESEEAVLRKLMKLFKDDNMGLEWSIRNTAPFAGDKNTSLASSSPAEVTEYMRAHWDEI